jgi:anti-sigma factor RsiW
MSAYLDRELASGTRGRMERHVAECEQCRRLLDGLVAMLNALHRLPAPAADAVGPQLASTVRMRLRLEEPWRSG